MNTPPESDLERTNFLKGALRLLAALLKQEISDNAAKERIIAQLLRDISRETAETK